MTNSEYELHKIIVKFVACSQVLVELMDELEGTRVYRQDIKFQIKNLSMNLEKFLTKAYTNIQDAEHEEIYMTVERGARILLDTSVEQMSDKGEIKSEKDS